MKNKISIFLFSIVAVAMFFSCQGRQDEKEISTEVVMNPASASGNSDSTRLPVITFEENTHDFGKILQGEKVSCSFFLKTPGKQHCLYPM